MEYYLPERLAGFLFKGKEQTGEARGGKYAARVQSGYEKDGSPKYRYFKTHKEYDAYMKGSGKKKDHEKKKKNREKESKEKHEKEHKESTKKQQRSSVHKLGESKQKQSLLLEEKKDKEVARESEEASTDTKKVSKALHLYLGV
jgi:hypothetical protein